MAEHEAAVAGGVLSGAAAGTAIFPGIGTVIGGAIGGLASIFGSKKAKKARKRQKKLDRENERLYKLEVNESIRRTVEQQTILEGTLGVQIGASGFARGSSLDRYFSTVQAQNKADVDWMKTSGASRSAIMARETEARSRASEAASKASLYGGIASSIGTIGQGFGMMKKFGGN